MKPLNNILIVVAICVSWIPAASRAQEVSTQPTPPAIETASATVTSAPAPANSMDMQLANPALKAEDVGLAQPGSSLRLSSLTD